MSDERPAVGTLEWVAPVPERLMAKRWVVVAAACGVVLVGWALFGQLWLGLFGGLAIIGSTHEVLFDARYRLDAQGARARVGLSVNEIAWANVRRVISGEEGVKLSPLSGEGSRLAPFRGVYLRFAGNRDAVMAHIELAVGEDAGVLGTRTDG